MGDGAPPTDVDLDGLLAEVADEARPHATEGEAKEAVTSAGEVGPDRFAMAVVEMDGTEHVTGEVDVGFPVQSIAKVVSLVLAMRRTRSEPKLRDELWSRVGREPSGDPFNSLVQLEHEGGIPRNPMINAGALVVDDLLMDACDDPKEDLRSLLEELVGERLDVDDEVLRAEGVRGHRNLAMAYLMSSLGNLHHDPQDVIDVYIHQCAVMVSTRQLARAVRFLGNGGVDPATGTAILEPAEARRVNAILVTAGTYDAVGDFAFDVGIPCKSSISGAIVGVVPAELGVGVWSPPLDDSGSSLAGRIALHQLSERLGLSLFSADRQPSRVEP